MPDYAVKIFRKETAQRLADRLRLLPVPIVSHIKTTEFCWNADDFREEKREFTAELKKCLMKNKFLQKLTDELLRREKNGCRN